MCSIARRKFECASLIVMLFGSFFTHVAFADGEPKTVAARDEQSEKLDATRTETGRQSDSDASETSAPQEPKRRALSAPLDPLFPGSGYLGPTPLIGGPDTDPEYPLEKALWSAFPTLKANRIKVYGWVNAGFVSVRPEVRYEYAFSARPWDNGTRKGPLMFAMDGLMRF